jgi:CHAD domain-containing protein
MYPGKKIHVLLDDLKSLQNNLGEFQDLHVQQCILRRYIIKLKQKGDIDKDIHKSMQILINKLEKRGQKARGKFDSKFKRISSSEDYELYKKLFKDKQPLVLENKC